MFNASVYCEQGLQKLWLLLSCIFRCIKDNLRVAPRKRKINSGHQVSSQQILAEIGLAIGNNRVDLTRCWYGSWKNKLFRHLPMGRSVEDPLAEMQSHLDQQHQPDKTRPASTWSYVTARLQLWKDLSRSIWITICKDVAIAWRTIDQNQIISNYQIISNPFKIQGSKQTPSEETTTS